MRIYKYILLFAFPVIFVFTGFQCSSTEITSGKLYIQQKNYDKAIEILKKEVEKNPQSDEGYYLLGYAYGEIGEIDKMLDAYEKSLSISNKFEKNITDSKNYFWANMFNRGASNYQRGVNAQDPDSMKMYLKRSASDFEYAVRLQPDSSDTYKNLAFVYMMMQENQKAIDPLKKLIELEKAEDGYRFLGEIYFTEGQQLMSQYKSSGDLQDSLKAMDNFNNAIKVLEEGRKEYPNNSDILVLLSNAYISADKIDVAMDAFKAGVEQDPENKFYRYNYGVLLLGAENYQEAEKQFKKAVEIDPEYQNAIYNLAVTYVRWGTKMNKEAEEQGLLSEEYKEKYRAALPYLEQVVEMEPDKAETWELLGRVYSVLGMEEDATKAFEKADSLRQ